MRKNSKISNVLFMLLIALFSFYSAALAQPTQQWIMHLNGYGNDDDQACAIALDPDENVIICGYSNGVTTGRDFGTAKYHPAAIEQWFSYYYTPGPVYVEQATALAVDLNGDIIVTGTTNGFGNGYDYYTIKYNPAGVQQWAARYNGSGSGNDTPHALAVDALGNIYITGESSAPGTNFDITTVKYSPNGDSLWVARFNALGSSTDKGWGIVVDNEGSAYVVGEGGMGFVTLKYSTTGQLLWSELIPTSTSAYHYGKVIAVDAGHNVYVSGYSVFNGGPSYDYLTIKYDPSGNELWQVRYNGPTNKADYPTAIAVDSIGNVYVTGYSNSSTTTETKNDFATVKYNSSGTQLWATRYNAPGDKSDNARAMAFDNQGCLYVTGESSNYPTSDFDYATACYNTTTGAEQWVIRYDGPTHGADYATDIVVDSDRNIYVTGYSPGTNLMMDWVTIKYAYALNHPNVTVTMTPLNPPIQIPGPGGTFQFNLNPHNYEPTPVNMSIWTMMRKLPHDPWTGPTVNVNRTLIGGVSPVRTLTQNIAGTLAPGTYQYQARVGIYPNEIWSISEFEFTKSSSGDDPWVGDFNISGELFEEYAAPTSPGAFVLVKAAPNPFNPTTAISFDLQAANHVSLRVYDTAGRLVNTLVDGWREMGSHEVTFDESRLPSGLYFVRLQTGSITALQKLLLLK